MWTQGVEKGTKWDIGRCEPYLEEDLLEAGLLDSVDGTQTALVPGCGRGYAVAALAKHGFQTTGLDISPKGAAQASEYLSTVGGNPSNAKIVVCDFFTHEPTYDVVFDSTFLCALPPSMREDWAKK